MNNCITNNVSNNNEIPNFNPQLKGNIVPHEWYKIITTKAGRPDLPALSILAEILYWYRPQSVYNKESNCFTYKSKFNGDVWQTSYEHFINKFNFSHERIRRVLVRLEELKIIKREFKTIYLKGYKYNNVLFIHLDKDLLFKYTENTKVQANTCEVPSFSAPKFEAPYPLNSGDHICIKNNTKNISNLDSELEKSNHGKEALSEFYKNNLIKKEEDSVISDSLKNIVTEEQGSNELTDELSSELITPCKKENIQVDTKKEVSFGYKAADQKVYKTKHLKDFHPLTKEEAVDVNWKAGREFSTNFTNELLQKLADKYPDRTFISRNHMLSYISKALRYEKHQAPLVNHETFRFVKNNKEALKQRAEAKYLMEVEDTRSIDKYSQLRRKIAASLESSIAYRLLTSCEFKTSEEIVKTEGSTKLEENNENIFKIKLSPKINLTEFQKEKLENEVKAVYGEVEIIYQQKKEKRVGWFNNNSKSNSKTNDIETNNPVLREIFKLLKIYNGEESGKNIYISWFSKIEAEVNQETKHVILKAPTAFIRDWIKNNFKIIYEQACKNLNLILVDVLT